MNPDEQCNALKRNKNAAPAGGIFRVIVFCLMQEREGGGGTDRQVTTTIELV